jgi:hypothetical protein
VAKWDRRRPISACGAEGLSGGGQPLDRPTRPAALGVAAVRQSSVEFPFFLPLRKPQGRGEVCAWASSQSGRDETGREWRAESPRSIWRPLMQPQRIEHVLPGTGTVLPTTAGVSEVQDNRRAYSTMFLLPALRCCCFLAFATDAVDRGPCCGRQTMPAHTELHTLHGERDRQTGVAGAGALLPSSTRGRGGEGEGERGSDQRVSDVAGNPDVWSICDLNCWGWASRGETSNNNNKVGRPAAIQCRGVRSRPTLRVDGRIARGRASGLEARQMASRLACYRDVLPANHRRAIGFSGTAS